MYHNSDYRLQTGCGFIIGLLLIFWVVSGLFSYAKQFYEDRQLLPTPITGTIVSYELYRDYEHTIKDIVVEFDYNGKTYTLDSREQVVFTTKTLREEISDDFSTIKVYVNPEDPQKSRVTRRLAGWETLLVLLIFWVVSGLFSYAKQFYEDRQLLPTPITGTIVSYELYRDYEHTIKDIVVEFDYNGKTYTLDSREQVVFTTKTLREEISDDFSTIKVYVNPEDPQKSRVTRRLAGWETLLVICICSFVCLGLTGFLIIRLIRVW